MGKESPSLKELQRRIGTVAKPIEFEIDRTVISNFVQAVGDSNPLWQDEAYARATEYGGVIAPPYLLCALMTVCLPDPRSGAVPLPVPEVPLPRERVLDGGEAWEFIQPMRLGDTVTSRSKLVNVFEREGKIGKMLFFVYETAYTNQRGQAVARASHTVINY